MIVTFMFIVSFLNTVIAQTTNSSGLEQATVEVQYDGKSASGIISICDTTSLAFVSSTTTTMVTITGGSNSGQSFTLSNNTYGVPPIPGATRSPMTISNFSTYPTAIQTSSTGNYSSALGSGSVVPSLWDPAISLGLSRHIEYDFIMLWVQGTILWAVIDIM